jgi:hypothetical protein
VKTIEERNAPYTRLGTMAMPDHCCLGACSRSGAEPLRHLCGVGAGVLDQAQVKGKSFDMWRDG